LPIDICFADNVVVPIPPRDIALLPDAALLTFELIHAEPEPTKVVADKELDVLF
jgi:hypothetical protein